MYTIPGYDNWKTTPPEPEFNATSCTNEDCGAYYPAAYEHVEGDECPTCERATLEEVEQPEPCYCPGTCYC